MDQQKDQREELRRKVKLLEEEIVQRTRNFMQSSRLKHKPSSNSKNLKSQQKGIQIDMKNTIQQLNSTADNKDNNRQQLIRLFEQLKNQIHQFFSKLLQSEEQKISQNQKGLNKLTIQYFISPIKNVNNAVLELVSCISGILARIEETSLKSSQHNSLLEIKSLKSKYISALDDLIKQIVSHPQQICKESEDLKKKLEKTSIKLKQAEVRCQFITKALNQSEQANYQLRLQIQQSEIKVRNWSQKEPSNKTKMDKLEGQNEKMKIKIEQMQVMKRQYLRAYSRMKQQKQQLELKLLDIQQIEIKVRQKYCLDPIHENSAEVNSGLKTIEQHIEDERKEQIVRINESQNCLSAIKEIIEYGLMQTNRSTSEKWIKSALLKLDSYEQNRIEQREKNIKSQSIIEESIHDGYKNMLNNINKAINRRKDVLQNQFNTLMDKMIKFKKEEGEGEETRQQNESNANKLQKDKQQQSVQEVGEVESEVEEKRMQQQSKVYELVSKLNESYVKYGELKKKYDVLLQKHESFQVKNSAPIDSQSQPNFNKFMDKIIHFQIKLKNTTTKFNEQFFDNFAHKVFQTLCNLPTTSHGQLFFVPTNQQELQDALDLIYKFSLQFDQIQEARLKQFKSEALSLTKIIEDIAVAKQVPAEMVIQSMNNNLSEQNCMSGDYVKTLIKKLSHQAEKNRSMDSIYTEGRKKGEAQMGKGRA